MVYNKGFLDELNNSCIIEILIQMLLKLFQTYGV
jgi:hypothetical protein